MFRHHSFSKVSLQEEEIRIQKESRRNHFFHSQNFFQKQDVHRLLPFLILEIFFSIQTFLLLILKNFL